MASPFGPPPPYRELDRKSSSPNLRYQIARKPVNTTTARPKTSSGPSVKYARDTESWQVERFAEIELHGAPPQLPPRPNLTLNISRTNISDSQLYLSPGSSHTSTATTPNSTGQSSVSSYFPPNNVSPTSTSPSQSSTSLHLQNAYREARHFAGGLIAHPAEVTKHYSILRHSHGLVLYQGTNTTLAVSIFADQPLPTDRTIWLQSKGWTGKTGMRARAFMGRNGNWLNVTPSTPVIAEQLKPSDERAWQRDIASFQKKAKGKVQQNHIPRETAIIRIPVEATDGYFQLVLCVGDKKKVLCPSPVFRVLSASSSPSSIRGASLATLPLELGALAFETYVRNTAGRVVAPVSSVVQGRVQNYMPSLLAQKAVITAYGAVGTENKHDSPNERTSDRSGYFSDCSFRQTEDLNLDPDQGPKPPYPINFPASTKPFQDDASFLGMRAFTLDNLPSNILRNLHGHYFGWGRAFREGKKSVPNNGEEIWSQVVISALLPNATQLARASLAEASKKIVTVRLIQEFNDFLPENSVMEFRVMGFIRQDEPSQRALLQKGLQVGDDAAVEAAMIMEFDDVSFSQSFLYHPAWTPDFTRNDNQRRMVLGLEKVKKGYAETRSKIDRVPFHKLGVRTPGDQARDMAVVVNGFYVLR